MEDPGDRASGTREARVGLPIGVVLLLFAAWVLAAAMQLPAGASQDPLGPRGFPLLLGIGLALSGATVLVGALAARSSGAAESEEAGPFSPIRFAGAIALSGAYVAALEPAGFLVATPLYMAGLAVLHGGVPPLRVLIASAGLTLALFALLSLLLGVSLPPGVLEGALRRGG